MACSRVKESCALLTAALIRVIGLEGVRMVKVRKYFQPSSSNVCGWKVVDTRVPGKKVFKMDRASSFSTTETVIKDCGLEVLSMDRVRDSFLMVTSTKESLKMVSLTGLVSLCGQLVAFIKDTFLGECLKGSVNVNSPTVRNTNAGGRMGCSLVLVKLFLKTGRLRRSCLRMEATRHLKHSCRGNWACHSGNNQRFT